ncbi:MAG: S8 family serine peptidase, partial [Xanthomonadales bacterium]|nr:S8 family serine peptidase [Xanthomonadales bacterium]
MTHALTRRTAACLLLWLVGTFMTIALPANAATLGPDLQKALRAQSAGVPIEVIVSFHSHEQTTALDSLNVPYLPLRALPFAGAYMTPAEIQAAAAMPEVRAIHLNSQLEYHHSESVPLTRAPEAWAQGYTGEGITVAILDTGIDGTHPDVAYPDKTVQNVKFVHTKFASWSHGNNTETVSLSVENLNSTDTTSGHGTHVAGSAAGGGAADSRFRGMAPGANLVGLGAGDDLYVYEALKAFDWLFIEDENGVPNHARYGIRAVNNSWGGGGGLELDVDNPIIQATFEAYRAGINVVFSAGNSGPSPDTYNFYALAPWNLGIGATDKQKSLVGFSSRGYPNHPLKTLDVSAPGQGINSANFYAWAAQPYASKSGTSMSSPHVTGLVALVLSANPQLSPDQVAEVIRASTTTMPGMEAWQVGTGFVDAAQATALAAATQGELADFLAGNTAHSLESAAQTPLPYQRVDSLTDPATHAFSGFIGPSVEVAPWSELQSFTVHAQTEFLTVFIYWDHMINDLDLILTAPDGSTYSSPTGLIDRALGPLGSAKVVRVVFPEAGEWTAEIRGWLAGAVDYQGEIVEYRVDGDPNWPDPDDEEPTFDQQIAVAGFYKLTPAALGFLANHWRSGDSGFLVYDVLDAHGQVVNGAQIDLNFVDRSGEVVRTDSTYFQRTDGSYDIDVVFDDTWPGTSGPYQVLFTTAQDLKLQADPFVFYLNRIDVAAETFDAAGNPENTFAGGETITVSGTLSEVNTHAAEDVSVTPVFDVPVEATLEDDSGAVVAMATGRSDLLTGDFSLSLNVPAAADSIAQVRVVAERSDALLLQGPSTWWGSAELPVRLPEEPNLPEAELQVSPDTIQGSQHTVQVQAEVRHGDGAAAIDSIDLRVTAGNGRIVERWSLADFVVIDETTLRLDTAYRPKGPSPWT